MEAPCKSHNRSLQSPRATVPASFTTFKAGPPAPLSRERFTPPPTFWVFAFVRKHRFPFPTIVFQFNNRTRQMENERRWISKPFDHNQFSSDIRIDDELGCEALQMEWDGVVVNDQFYATSRY
ncbi:hypothetical protein AVEN_187180-1 [Araneus ventricosus]|uniref:Uncharacterized protein n=1 Tax=Araneus ventricosus TaxID=182803 RepID=A0A4Y2JJW9_ARAVE|nr:hypothetical protein AVEN_187180-1 [Araneus ventricosus]